MVINEFISANMNEFKILKGLGGTIAVYLGLAQQDCNFFLACLVQKLELE